MEMNRAIPRTQLAFDRDQMLPRKQVFVYNAKPVECYAADP
jgi:hypothetical protein